MIEFKIPAQQIINETLTNLHNNIKEIRKFRKSKEWKRIRINLIKTRGGKCEWCGSSIKLSIAHQVLFDNLIDYKNNINLCLILCQRCHFAQHKDLIYCKKDKKYHTEDYYFNKISRIKDRKIQRIKTLEFYILRNTIGVVPLVIKLRREENNKLILKELNHVKQNGT